MYKRKKIQKKKKYNNQHLGRTNRDTDERTSFFSINCPLKCSFFIRIDSIESLKISLYFYRIVHKRFTPPKSSKRN